MSTVHVCDWKRFIAFNFVVSTAQHGEDRRLHRHSATPTVLGMGSSIIIELARFSLFVCEVKVHRYVAILFWQALGGVVPCLCLLALLACCDSARQLVPLQGWGSFLFLLALRCMGLLSDFVCYSKQTRRPDVCLYVILSPSLFCLVSDVFVSCLTTWHADRMWNQYVSILHLRVEAP